MSIKTVVKYIRRSPYQALAATLIMMLTFFIVSVFAITTVFSMKLIDHFESRPQLTVFFKDQVAQNDILAMKKELESTGKISNIRYVSKNEALKIYQEQNKNDPILLELVTADILPASLEIQTTKAEYLSELAKTIHNPDTIEEVVFQKDIVDKLVAIISGIKKVGITMIAVLSVVSVFMIVTIIGIKITIRKEEIEIMRLIGATNWFIRAPFILEGMFYGFVGSVAGGLLSFCLLQYSNSYLEKFLQGIPVLPLPTMLLLRVFGLEVIFACLLGAFASYLAVLRYLK